MVSRRKAKKAEKMQLKAQGMTLDQARKIIYQAMDGVSVKTGDYKEALSLIEADDAGFAAEIKDFIAKKAKEDELREAYQIVGGYKKTISENVYNRAMKQVEADDAEFAAAIRELGGVRFAQAEYEDLNKAEQAVYNNKKEAEQAAQALADINTDEILADEEVQELFDNTPVFTASDTEAPREDVEPPVTATVLLNEIDNIASGTAPTEEPKKRFRLGFKKFFARLRIKESDGSIQGIKDAFNFKKKIRVSAKSLVESFRNSYNRATKAISNFAKRGYTAAAAWLNKSKVKVCAAAIAGAGILIPVGCTMLKNNEHIQNPEKTPGSHITLDSLKGTSAAMVSALPADSVAADTLAVKPNAVLTTAADMPITINELPADTVFAADVTSGQFVINELPADTISGAAAQQFLSASEISADSTQFVSTRIETASDSTQIVTDSDSIPFGTPAAGYVAERGGVNNCGLTADQLKYSKSKIRSYGDSAYEDLMNGITDEMLSKGNIFEGLTREQAIYNLSVWSAVYPHSKETTLIYDYVLNCHKGETMSAGDTARAKAAMDKIRINKTIDGVTYAKPLYVESVNNMGCGERVRVNSITVSNTRPTAPSGPKFPRLFQLRAISPEPIIHWEKTDTIVETTIKEVPRSPEITLHRGSDLNVAHTDSLGTVNTGDVTGITVTDNTRVLVEKNDSTVSESSTPASRPAQAHTTKAKKGGKKKLSMREIERQALEQAHRETCELFGLNSSR